MPKTVIVDIDNCIANINRELKKLGYWTDLYPSPIPTDIFIDGSLFSNALPMVSVIKKIEEMVKGNSTTFLTARSDSENIKNITTKWIKEHTHFDFPILFRGGISKGYVMELEILDKVSLKGEIVIFEDSSHETMSYLNMKKKYDLNMTIYVPEWEYNKHIEAEGIIKL